MSQMQFAVKCQLCRHMTKDASGRCPDHRNINGSAVRHLAFGGGLTPKSETPDDGNLYILAGSIQEDISTGVVYELDITDGYGEEFDEISSITDAAKPNDGMLAFSTKGGTTIFFLPEEYVDVRLKQADALV